MDTRSICIIMALFLLEDGYGASGRKQFLELVEHHFAEQPYV